jgi:hypothetical protein
VTCSSTSPATTCGTWASSPPSTAAASSTRWTGPAARSARRPPGARTWAPRSSWRPGPRWSTTSRPRRSPTSRPASPHGRAEVPARHQLPHPGRAHAEREEPGPAGHLPALS